MPAVSSQQNAFDLLAAQTFPGEIDHGFLSDDYSRVRKELQALPSNPSTVYWVNGCLKAAGTLACSFALLERNINAADKSGWTPETCRKACSLYGAAKHQLFNLRRFQILNSGESLYIPTTEAFANSIESSVEEYGNTILATIPETIRDIVARPLPDEKPLHAFIRSMYLLVPPALAFNTMDEDRKTRNEVFGTSRNQASQLASASDSFLYQMVGTDIQGRATFDYFERVLKDFQEASRGFTDRCSSINRGSELFNQFKEAAERVNTLIPDVLA